VNASLVAVLNDAERLAVAETEPAALAGLDEDAAIELETRIRRVRDKYVSQYRRGASARVAEKGGRGKARPQNERAAMKAEAFERALGRVSHRVAVLAKKAAAELRTQRLAAARAVKGQPAAGRAGRSAPAASGGVVTAERRGDRALRSPASEKRRASTRAMGDRRQARRDTRRALAK
jgi:hypothetical protein